MYGDKRFKIKLLTYEKVDIFDSVSIMDTLQSIKTYRQGIMRVVEIAHMKNEDFAAILPFTLQISCPDFQI